jgi:hypothetical protein
VLSVQRLGYSHLLQVKMSHGAYESSHAMLYVQGFGYSHLLQVKIYGAYESSHAMYSMHEHIISSVLANIL